MLPRITSLALVACAASIAPARAATPGLACILYVGGAEKPLTRQTDTLKATDKGITVTLYSMGDDSFTNFQAVLQIPRLSDIRAYATKDGLAATGGMVVEYLNRSRADQVSVTCEKTTR